MINHGAKLFLYGLLLTEEKTLLSVEYTHDAMTLSDVGNRGGISSRRRKAMYSKWNCMSEEELNRINVFTDVKTQSHIQDYLK